MELYIYDRDMALLGLVDEIKALVWTRRYWDCGEFSLLVPMTSRHAALLQPGRIIARKDDDQAGQVRYIGIARDANGLEQIEIKGLFLTHWIGKRVLQEALLMTAPTQAVLERIVRENLVAPTDPIAKGAIVSDCIGLVKGYYWTNDAGKMVYGLDGRPDKGANGMFTAAKVKEPIAVLPEIPGLLLYAPGHAGVYIGGGWAIEARGFDYGVVKTQVSKRSWTHYYECPFILYTEVDDGGHRQTEQALEEANQAATGEVPNAANQTPKDSTGAAPNPAGMSYGARLLRYVEGRKMQNGDDVRAIQLRLSALGHSPGKIDGVYGPKSEQAVKAFQGAAGIKADGIVGPVTRGHLQP